MAKRRMFSREIIEGDSFFSLPPSSQMLYLHLNLNADDDGIVDGLKRLMRSLSVERKYYRALVERGFIIELSDGIVAITHWLIHNQIRRDRYLPTRYTEAFRRLTLGEDSRYIKGKEAFFDNQMSPQDSLGELSKEKDSIDECSIEKGSDAADDLISDGDRTRSLPAACYVDTLTAEERLRYSVFLNEVKLYFMSRHQTINISGFINYNESRHWCGKGGESVIENYKRYIDDWVKQERRGSV